MGKWWEKPRQRSALLSVILDLLCAKFNLIFRILPEKYIINRTFVRKNSNPYAARLYELFQHENKAHATLYNRLKNLCGFEYAKSEKSRHAFNFYLLNFVAIFIVHNKQRFL